VLALLAAAAAAADEGRREKTVEALLPKFNASLLCVRRALFLLSAP
jgi:hypothetical protein